MAIAITKDQEMAAHWKTQIELVEKEYRKWHKRAEKISKYYRDERDDNSVGVARRLNLFWANTETLKPAVYAKTPIPICERRFLDKDPIGRTAATILERTLRYEVQMSGYDNAVRRARNDWLVPGRGQVWIRYYPLFGESISPEQTGNDDIDGPDGEPIPEDAKTEGQERELLRETICVDYLHWQDYFTFPPYARTEEEIEGKGRRIFMSRSDLIENFGEKKGRKIELDHGPGDEDGNKQAHSKNKEGFQATVYEIWWKPERKVYFIAKSYSELCKEVDDPLKLEGFFPCPCPLNATMTNDTTIPVPDYAESQDQYSQIDDLTKRIDILTGACKIVGAYNSASEGLKRIFEEENEPNLIPVDSWAMFAQSGGIKNNIELVDIRSIAETLKILIETRQQIMADLDRTTGISDIMRGTSDARETMGAQRLKTNNSSTRLQDRQAEIQRFCRDIIAIMGEIIAEQYQPETLIQISGAMNDEALDPPPLPQNPMMGHNMGPPMAPPGPMGTAVPTPMGGPPTSPGPPMGPPQPSLPAAETPEMKQQRKLQMIMQAIGLLRQDKLRGFRIDIETDSIIAGDQQQQQESAVQFITNATQFIEKAAQISAMVPEFTPLAGKMLQAATRRFKFGRDLESAIDEFCDMAEQDAKEKKANPPPPKPDPEQIKMETEKIKQQGTIQAQQVEAQSEQTNAQIRMQEMQVKQQAEGQRSQLEIQAKQLDMQIKTLDLEIAKIRAGADVEKTQLDLFKSRQEVEFKQQDHARSVELAEKQERAAKAPKEASEHLDKLHEAAKIFDLASRRNAAPKKVVRGADGKISHVTTDFQERENG